jgi:hypothetical protein
MYQWLGKLMGIALRTGYALDLNLSQLTWKALVGQPRQFDDLRFFDPEMHRHLSALLDDDKLVEKGAGPDVFEFVFPFVFTMFRSDGDPLLKMDGDEAVGDAVVELCLGGKDKALSWDNRSEWVHLVSDAIFKQSDRQTMAIREGLAMIVPADKLNLFTWREMENMVCGQPDIDIDVLRKICRYSGLSPNDACVKNFWVAMERMDQQQRRDFVQFTWGRTRLMPAERMKGDNALQLTPFSHATPDSCLPVAHTCFFQLELPDYSTPEIAFDRINYATSQTGGYFAFG